MGMRLGIGKALQMFTVFSTKLHFDNNHFSLLRVHLGKVHTNINRQNWGTSNVSRNDYQITGLYGIL